MDFFTGGSVIMDYGQYLIVKNVLMMDLFLTSMQILALRDVN